MRPSPPGCLASLAWHSPRPWPCPKSSHASTWPLVLILHNNEVTVTEGKVTAITKAAYVNVDPFWPGLFAKAPASVNSGSLICNAGAGGPAQQLVRHQQEVLPPQWLLPQLKKRKTNLRSLMMTRTFIFLTKPLL